MPNKNDKKLEEMLKKFDELEKRIINEFEAETAEIERVCNQYTIQELYEEAVNLYDSLIEQYYKYETKSYYRHNAGVGTGWGDNLYYGKDFYIDNNFDLNIEFNGKNMEKYKNDTRDEVLSIVKAGFRGVPGKWLKPWEGSYDGLYFGISDTNIDNAFRVFETNFNYMYEYIFKSKLKEERKKKKYKYWRI